ncbi:hypothetical protein DEA8626_00699 [Defluviimonas aquaemixtae]|uniref:Zinc resistance-associated protein n=1 Tax=Albidovulum aquaemixtae TaxID=1542388 RepID=A0A2R8B3W4_9RHOB|nr:periplasmic heavy metal sensor [Defluviimonas aquaemixtae]SPH17183.1 hypothetical protein DEA8626_00699 [Defluviimonas aquaemixtae]
MAKTEGQGPRMRASVKWLLILSLGLNLFVVASVAGRALGPHGRHDHRRGPDVGFGAYTEALSWRDRSALRDAFLKAAPDYRERREEMRADLGRIVAALRAEPWDQATVEAIIAAQGARAAERLDLGRRLFAEHLAGMSPDERHAFAERIEEALENRRR